MPGGYVGRDVALTIEWPTQADDRLREQCHRVIAAVVERGGAVGWMTVPPRSVTDTWLDEMLGQVRRGRAGLATITWSGRVEAIGTWTAGPEGAIGHVAELTKIMVHPEARGLGAGRAIVEALVATCADSGCESISLGVRGNNHGAITLYEACGFSVWGVLPNGVAVGEYRFDDVRMHRPLNVPEGVRFHGSAPGGPGWSARGPVEQPVCEAPSGCSAEPLA